MSTKCAPRHPFPWDFVMLTYLFSWSVWIASWFATGKPDATATSSSMMVAIFVGSFGPGWAAIMLTARHGGIGSVKTWLGAFIRFRCGWKAYAAGLLPFPLVVLLLTALFGYTPISEGAGGRAAPLFYLTIFPFAVINGVVTTFFGAGPIGEEGGWRGYLLPRLLERHSELGSSLIIGVIWALWHLPVMVMFADWRDGIDFWTYLPIYLAVVTALSYLMTKVWLIGKGSLVPVIWLHGIFNAVGPMAFNHKLWSSNWSQEFAGLLFAFAAILSVGLLYIARWTRPNAENSLRRLKTGQARGKDVHSE